MEEIKATYGPPPKPGDFANRLIQIFGAGALDGKGLNLGCGDNKLPGFLNVDGNARCKPDQLIDLNVGLWPLFGKFDVVVASHVLEHVDSPIKLVHEVHRALNPGGRLLVVVPNAWSDGGLCNPLHRNYFTMHTFVYFRADTYNQPRTAGYLANEGYPIADWASVKVGVIPEPAWSENPRIEFGSRHYINVLSEVCAVLTKRS